jgi:hypothetical protein
MSFESRARYEAGDPIDDYLAREARRDHLWARARGERLADLTRQILSALDGQALLVDVERATPIVFSTLADLLFGNHSIDLPSMIRGKAEDDPKGSI